ncbi:MAG: hypothetical protein KC668_13035 [Myxococcales bacterium]|nr:hypothetical protein [Myxococcales bacterium]
MLGTAERALLERLEDEQVLERAFRVRTGRAAAPDEAPALPARAAGLLAELSQTSAGRDAVVRARQGDTHALDALLDASTETARSPRLLHHLALFHGAVAEAARGPDPSPMLRSVDCWALLCCESDYLRALAERVAGGALSRAELDEAIAGAALAPILREGAHLAAGVEAHTTSARVGLERLRAVGTHAFPAAVTDEMCDRFRREAERLTRRALDASLATLTDRFAQAEADPRGPDAERAVLADAARLYAWSGNDWYIALFALEKAMGTGWSLYKAKRWEALSHLCETLRAVVDDAAVRVSADRAALPYASLVAQMLVFRAEMGKTLGLRITDAERALELCDTHRNARVILADLLAERATDTLDRTGVIGRDAALEVALRDLARADQLWPGLPRVVSLRKRIDRMSGVSA